MIYSVINSWFEDIQDEFNRSKDTTYKLRPVTATAKQPLNQQHLYWKIQPLRIEADYTIEARGYYNVTGVISLSVFLGSKNQEEFSRIFDNNFWMLVRMIDDSVDHFTDSTLSQSIILMQLKGLTLVEGKIIENGYFEPSLEFTMWCYCDPRVERHLAKGERIN